MTNYKPYQLAKKMNVKIQTIYRWIRENKFPEGSVKKVNIVKEITIISVPDFFIEEYKKSKRDK